MSGLISFLAYKAHLVEDEIVRMANCERDEALSNAEQADYDRDVAVKDMKEIAARHTAAINEIEVLRTDLHNSSESEKQWRALYNHTYDEVILKCREIESITANEMKLVDEYEAKIVERDEELKKDLRRANQKASYNESQCTKINDKYFMQVGRTNLLNASLLTKDNEIKDLRGKNSRLMKFIRETRETATTTKNVDEARQLLIAAHNHAITAIKNSHEEEKQTLLSVHKKAMDEIKRKKQPKRLSKGTLKLQEENQALIAAAAKKAEEEESLRKSGGLIHVLGIKTWEITELRAKYGDLKKKALRKDADNKELVVKVQRLEAQVQTLGDHECDHTLCDETQANLQAAPTEAKFDQDGVLHNHECDHTKCEGTQAKLQAALAKAKSDQNGALQNHQSTVTKLNVDVRDLTSKLAKATQENETSKKELGSVKAEFENLQKIHASCPQASTNAQTGTGVGQSSSQPKDVETNMDIDQQGGEPRVAEGSMDIDDHRAQPSGAQDSMSDDQPAEEERMDLDSPLQTLLDQSKEDVLRLEAINNELLTALRNNTTTDLEDEMQHTPTDEMASRIRQEIEQEYKERHANLQSLLNEKIQELSKKDRALAQTNTPTNLRKELDEQKKKVSELEYKQAKGDSGAGSSTQCADGTGEEVIRKLGRELKAAKGHILNLNKAFKKKVADHSDLEQLLRKKDPKIAEERQERLKMRDELEETREKATSLEEQLKDALTHQTTGAAEEPPQVKEQPATSTAAAAPAATAPTILSPTAFTPSALPLTASAFAITPSAATLPTAAPAGIKRAKDNDEDEGGSDEIGNTCERKKQRTLEPYSRPAAGDAMVQDGGATMVASTEGGAEVGPLDQLQHVYELRVARDGKKKEPPAL